MKLIVALLCSITASIALSQEYVNQVLILNEGYFDYTSQQIIEPVSVGIYDPSTNAYEEVNTIDNMRFASDLILDGSSYYVAADSKIIKFDLNTHQELASVVCEGVRNLAVYNDLLIATRGEYLMTFDSYLHVYSTSDLSLTASFDTQNGPKWATQNIVVNDNKAYIAVNNAYEWGNEKGIIGVLDLTTLSYGNEVDLGPDGKNPDNLIRLDDFIYTVNNKDWTGTSVSKIALDLGNHSTTNVASATTGCGTSALRDGKLTYQLSMETSLNEFNLVSMSTIGTVSGTFPTFYELKQDPVGESLYASETDFFSYGEIHIYDGNNMEINSFNTGISPGTIVFDVRNANELPETSNAISISPNPAANVLHVMTELPGTTILLDKQGKKLMESHENSIDITSLTKGVYYVKKGGFVKKFIKQ